MAKLLDMVGKKSGKLTVLKRADADLNYGVMWECQCDCGKIVNVSGHSLRRKNINTESCGCLKKTHFIDLTGLKFNNLSIIKYVGKDNEKNHVYLVKCSCGKEFTAQGSDIKTGKIKTCGCGRFKKHVENYLNDTKLPHLNSIYVSYKHGAANRDYEFSLTKEVFSKLIQQNCYYCNEAPANMHRHSKRRKADPNSEPYLYNGIDRIDNDKGYTLENCVPCCKGCNIAKHLMTQDAFITKAYKIVEMDKKRNTIAQAKSDDKNEDMW